MLKHRGAENLPSVIKAGLTGQQARRWSFPSSIWHSRVDHPNSSQVFWLWRFFGFIGRWALFQYSCRRFFLQLADPPSQVSPTSWVIWSLWPPIRYNLAGILSSNCRTVFIYLQFTAIGKHFRTTIQVFRSPRDVPNYAITQAIFVGSAVAYTIFLALIGPENHGSHFERSKLTFQAGASKGLSRKKSKKFRALRGRMCGVREMRRRVLLHRIEQKVKPGAAKFESHLVGRGYGLGGVPVVKSIYDVFRRIARISNKEESVVGG